MTEVISGILGAFGLSVSAGLNAYIPLLVVSLLAKFTDLIELAKLGRSGKLVDDRCVGGVGCDRSHRG